GGSGPHVKAAVTARALDHEDRVRAALSRAVDLAGPHHELLAAELGRVVEDPVLVPALVPARLDQPGRQVVVLVEVRVAVPLPVDELEYEPLAVPLSILAANVLP